MAADLKVVENGEYGSPAHADGVAVGYYAAFSLCAQVDEVSVLADDRHEVVGVHLDPAADPGRIQEQGEAGALGCDAPSVVLREALLQGGVAVGEAVEKEGFGETADAGPDAQLRPRVRQPGPIHPRSRGVDSRTGTQSSFLVFSLGRNVRRAQRPSSAVPPTNSGTGSRSGGANTYPSTVTVQTVRGMNAAAPSIPHRNVG